MGVEIFLKEIKKEKDINVFERIPIDKYFSNLKKSHIRNIYLNFTVKEIELILF